MKTKLYVATPCFGNKLFADYMLDVMDLDHACRAWDIEFDVSLVGNFPVLTLARNTCAKHFLDSNFTHMLFVDADISFSPWNAKRLLDFDKDFCCAAYPKKTIHWDRLVGKTFDSVPNLENAALDYAYNPVSDAEVQNGFVEAKTAATGFMLLKRTVFEQMIEAYPERRFKPNYKMNNQSANDDNLYGFFDTMIDPVTQEYHGDDNSFCKRWVDIGGKIYVDVTLPLTHVGIHPFGRSIQKDVLTDPASLFPVTLDIKVMTD